MRYAIKRQKEERTQTNWILWSLGVGLGALAMAIVPDAQFHLLADMFYSLIGA